MDKYQQAYQRYLEGLSLAQVAKELNVTRQSVFKFFKKRGYLLRGPNFQPEQYYDGVKFTLRNHGYYSLTNNNRCLMHRYVWMKERGVIPYNHDIHHIDEDRSNNNIWNLECIEKADHTRLHHRRKKEKQCST